MGREIKFSVKDYVTNFRNILNKELQQLDFSNVAENTANKFILDAFDSELKEMQKKLEQLENSVQVQEINISSIQKQLTNIVNQVTNNLCQVIKKTMVDASGSFDAKQFSENIKTQMNEYESAGTGISTKPKTTGMKNAVPNQVEKPVNKSNNKNSTGVAITNIKKQLDTQIDEYLDQQLLEISAAFKKRIGYEIIWPTDDLLKVKSDIRDVLNTMSEKITLNDENITKLEKYPEGLIIDIQQKIVDIILKFREKLLDELEDESNHKISSDFLSSLFKNVNDFMDQYSDQFQIIANNIFKSSLNRTRAVGKYRDFFDYVQESNYGSLRIGVMDGKDSAKKHYDWSKGYSGNLLEVSRDYDENNENSRFDINFKIDAESIEKAVDILFRGELSKELIGIKKKIIEKANDGSDLNGNLGNSEWKLDYINGTLAGNIFYSSEDKKGDDWFESLFPYNILNKTISELKKKYTKEVENALKAIGLALSKPEIQPNISVSDAFQANNETSGKETSSRAELTEITAETEEIKKNTEEIQTSQEVRQENKEAISEEITETEKLVEAKQDELDASKKLENEKKQSSSPEESVPPSEIPSESKESEAPQQPVATEEERAKFLNQFVEYYKQIKKLELEIVNASKEEAKNLRDQIDKLDEKRFALYEEYNEKYGEDEANKVDDEAAANPEVIGYDDQIRKAKNDKVIAAKQAQEQEDAEKNEYLNKIISLYQQIYDIKKKILDADESEKAVLEEQIEDLQAQQDDIAAEYGEKYGNKEAINLMSNAENSSIVRNLKGSYEEAAQEKARRDALKKQESVPSSNLDEETAKLKENTEAIKENNEIKAEEAQAEETSSETKATEIATETEEIRENTEAVSNETEELAKHTEAVNSDQQSSGKAETRPDAKKELSEEEQKVQLEQNLLELYKQIYDIKAKIRNAEGSEQESLKKEQASIEEQIVTAKGSYRQKYGDEALAGLKSNIFNNSELKEVIQNEYLQKAIELFSSKFTVLKDLATAKSPAEKSSRKEDLDSQNRRLSGLKSEYAGKYGQEEADKLFQTAANNNDVANKAQESTFLREIELLTKIENLYTQIAKAKNKFTKNTLRNEIASTEAELEKTKNSYSEIYGEEQGNKIFDLASNSADVQAAKQQRQVAETVLQTEKKKEETSAPDHKQNTEEIKEEAKATEEQAVQQEKLNDALVEGQALEKADEPKTTVQQEVVSQEQTETKHKVSVKSKQTSKKRGVPTLDSGGQSIDSSELSGLLEVVKGSIDAVEKNTTAVSENTTAVSTLSEKLEAENTTKPEEENKTESANNETAIAKVLTSIPSSLKAIMESLSKISESIKRSSEKKKAEQKTKETEGQKENKEDTYDVLVKKGMSNRKMKYDLLQMVPKGENTRQAIVKQIHDLDTEYDSIKENSKVKERAEEYENTVMGSFTVQFPKGQFEDLVSTSSKDELESMIESLKQIYRYNTLILQSEGEQQERYIKMRDIYNDLLEEIRVAASKGELGPENSDLLYSEAFKDKGVQDAIAKYVGAEQKAYNDSESSEVSIQTKLVALLKEEADLKARIAKEDENASSFNRDRLAEVEAAIQEQKEFAETTYGKRIANSLYSNAENDLSIRKARGAAEAAQNKADKDSEIAKQKELNEAIKEEAGLIKEINALEAKKAADTNEEAKATYDEQIFRKRAKFEESQEKIKNKYGEETAKDIRSKAEKSDKVLDAESKQTISHIRSDEKAKKKAEIEAQKEYDEALNEEVELLKQIQYLENQVESATDSESKATLQENLDSKREELSNKRTNFQDKFGTDKEEDIHKRAESLKGLDKLLNDYYVQTQKLDDLRSRQESYQTVPEEELIAQEKLVQGLKEEILARQSLLGMDSNSLGNGGIKGVSKKTGEDIVSSQVKAQNKVNSTQLELWKAVQNGESEESIKNRTTALDLAKKELEIAKVKVEIYKEALDLEKQTNIENQITAGTAKSNATLKNFRTSASSKYNTIYNGLENAKGDKISLYSIELDNLKAKLDDLKNYEANADFGLPETYQYILQTIAGIDELVKKLNSEGFNKVSDKLGTAVAEGVSSTPFTSMQGAYGWLKSTGTQVEDVERVSIGKDFNSATVVYKNQQGTIQTLKYTYDELSNSIHQTVVSEEQAKNSSEELEQRFNLVGNQIKNLVQRYTSLYAIINQIRTAISSLTSLDSEMKQLQLVTEASSSEMKALVSQIQDVAQSVGSTNLSVAQSVTEWSRLGYSASDSLDLAAAAAKYASTGFTDVSTATTSLTSTIQAFKSEMTDDESLGDFAESIVDRFVDIGNKYATTAEGLGTALTSSGSSLIAAGNTLDESIALITAADTMIQDTDSVGSGLKIVSMRLRGTTASDLSNEGEDTEGVIENASKLYATIKKLTKTADNKKGISILTDSGEYKSTYEILKEISEVWDDMSDLNQASLLETIAGKNRANIISALLQAKDDDGNPLLETVYDATSEAAGAVDDAMDVVGDSIEFAQQRFQNSWTSLLQNAELEDFIKLLYNAGTAVVDLADNFGLLRTAVIALAGVGGVKISDILFGEDKQEFVEYMKNDGTLSGYFNDSKKSLVSDKQRTIDLSILEQYNALAKEGKVSGEELNLVLKGSSTQLQDVVKQCDGVAVSTDVYNNAIQATTVSLIKEKIQLVALNLAFNAVFAVISMVATLLATKLVDAVDSFIHSDENAIEAADNLKISLSEGTEEMQEQVDTLQTLADKYKELSAGVSDSGWNMSLDTDEYEEYKDLVSEIVSKYPDLIQGYSEEYGWLVDKEAVLERINAEQEKLIEKDAKQYLDNDNLDTLYTGAKAEAKDLGSNVQPEFISLFRESLVNKQAGSGYDPWKVLANIFDVNGNFSDEILGNIYSNVGSWSGNKDEILNELVEDFDLSDEVAARFSELFGSIADSVEDPYAEIKENFFSSVLTLNDNDLNNAQELFYNSLQDFVPSDAFSSDENRKKLQESLNTLINSLSDENSDISSAITNLFNLDLDDLTVAQAKAALDEYIQQIVDYLKETLGIDISAEDIADAVGKGEDYSLTSRLKTRNQEILGNSGLEDLSKDKLMLGAQLDAFTAGLTTDQAEVWLEATTGVSNYTEALEAYNNALNETASNENKITDFYSANKDDLETYYSKIETLQGYLDKYNSGELTAETMGSTLPTFESETGIKEEDFNAITLEGIDDAIVEKMSEAWDDLKDAIGDPEDYMDPDVVVNFFSEIEKGISKTKKAQKSLSDFKQTLVGLKSFDSSINALTSAYDDLQSGDAISIDDWQSLTESFGDLPSFDDFVESAAGAKKITKSVQSAFNQLTTEILYSSSIIDKLVEQNGQLTDSEKALMVQQLKEMGITNSQEVVNGLLSKSVDELVLRKATLALQTVDLANITDENRSIIQSEIDTLISEATAAGISEEALNKLELMKKLCNLTAVNTSADIEQLIALANTAGIAATSLSAAANAKNLLAKLETGGYTPTIEDLAILDKFYKGDWANEVKAQLLNADDYKATATANFGGSSSGSGSGSSGSDSTKEMDWISIKIEKLEKQIEDFATDAADMYLPWEERNKALLSQLEAIGEEIDIQQEKADEWNKKAAEVDLSDEYKKLVDEGGDFIEEFDGDSTVYEAIQKYQEYKENAEEAIDKIKELKTTQKELNDQKLDDLIDQYTLLAEAVQSVIDQSNLKKFFYGSEGYVGDALLSLLEEEYDKYLEAYEKAQEEFEKSLTDPSLGYINDGELTEAGIEAQKQVVEAGQAAKEFFESIADTLVEPYQAEMDLTESVLSLAQKENSGKVGSTSLNEQIDAINKNTDAIKLAVNALQAWVESNPNMTDDQKNTILTQINELLEDIEDNSAQIVEAILDDFDKVATAYENAMGLLEHKANLINAKIDLADAQGYMASGVYYEALISNAEQELELLKQEKSVLTEKMTSALNSGYIEEYSDAWYEMQNQINSVDESILDVESDIQEFNNEIRQIEWDRFDYMQESISALNDEFDFLIDLMEKTEDLYDDNGNLNTYGYATVSLHKKNYETYGELAKNYQEEIKKLDNEFATDKLNKDYLERRQELLEQSREYILAQAEEKQAVLDLVEEAYQTQLDALQEIIDKKKEALDAEKDIYDYQKKVSEQTEEIAEIQKQLSAFSGDDSEEAKKNVQQLKEDLKDSIEDLNDTEYDQYVSDQEALFDRIYDDYEEWIDNRLKDEDSLLEDIFAEVSDRGEDIETILGDISTEWNYERLMDSVDTIKDRVTQMYERADAKAEEDVEWVNDNTVTQDLGTIYNGEILSSGTAGSSSSSSNTTSSSSSSSAGPQDDDWYKYNHVAPSVFSPQYKNNTEDTSTYDLDSQEFEDMVLAAAANGNKLSDTSSKYKDTDWYKAAEEIIKEHGYYKGGVLSKAIKNSKEDGIFFGRTGEEVVTEANLAKLSEAFNQADLFADFYKSLNSIKSGAIPNAVSTDIGNLNVEISLPNVQDYASFKSQLIRDQGFEKAMTTMINNAVSGKSSLSKYRYS